MNIPDKAVEAANDAMQKFALANAPGGLQNLGIKQARNSYVR